MSSPSPIPTVYRILFTFIDPAFCLLGFAQHIFDPTTTLRGYSASSIFPPATETVHLLDSMAGFFLMLGVLEAVLLRARARDVTVWRIVQASISLLDLVMVGAALRALGEEGRLDWRGWRADDWRLVVGNAGMGALRAGCACGVGIGGLGKGKRG